MKPQQWLSELVKGVFALPEAPEHEVPGVIVLRDGIYRLELIGAFDESDGVGLRLAKRNYPLIMGWLSNGGPVTLIGCSGSESFSAPGLATEQVSFMAAVKGFRFMESDELKFDSVVVHLSDLSTWIGIHGLESSFPLRDDCSPPVVWTARYLQPPPIRWALADGGEASVRFTASFPTTSNRGDVTLRQDCQLVVRGAEDQTLFELRSRAFDIQLLLKLLSGFKMQLTIDSVTHRNVQHEDVPTSLPALVNRKSFSQAEPTKPELFDALVPFAEISGRMEELIRVWATMLNGYGDAVRVALADLYGATRESTVANLANSILRYEEAAAGRKLRLSEALSPVLVRYCSTDVAARATELAEASRHYYTHFNPVVADKAATGADLANLVDLLELIHRCVLLERLGLSTDEVRQWIRRSQRFREHLSMDRWQEFG